MHFPARMVPALLTAALIVGGLWGYQRLHPAPKVVQRGEPATVYSTRGRIEQLPGTSRAAMLQIHHEKIPEFKDRDGSVVGMNAMVMPFAWDAGVSLEGLRVGDEVAFTFEHVWGEPPRITRLEKTAAGQN